MNPFAIGLLGGVAGLAGGAYLGRSRLFSDLALLAKPTPKVEGLIDTHHHLVPSFYVDAYIEAMGEEAFKKMTPGGDFPKWSPEQDLEVMDEFNVRKAVLSAPMGTPGPTPEARAMLARRLNDFGAELVTRRPDRYALFGSVPLPDVDASLKEAAYALDTLKAVGLIVFTSYDSAYLGDAVFDPFWQEMNRRKAVIFVHPTVDAPAYHFTDIPAGIVEFVFDTTRTVGSLIFSGVTLKYPNIKFIFSHGGGALPYVSMRMEGLTRLSPKLKQMLPNGLKPEIRKLYWDTALCFDPTQVPSLLALTDPSRIMFGSDFPFAAKMFFPLSLKSLGSQIDEKPLRQILTQTAHDVMPSLARSGQVRSIGADQVSADFPSLRSSPSPVHR